MKIQEIAYQAFEFVNAKTNRKLKNYLEYKGCIGTTEFSAEDKVFYGKNQGLNDIITFEECL